MFHVKCRLLSSDETTVVTFRHVETSPMTPLSVFTEIFYIYRELSPLKEKYCSFLYFI